MSVGNNECSHERDGLPDMAPHDNTNAPVPQHVPHSRNSGCVQAEAVVVNLGNRGVMATGICFLVRLKLHSVKNRV